MVLASGILLDEARRTGVGWTKRRKRTVSAVNGKELALHPTRITPPPIAMHVSQRSAAASNEAIREVKARNVRFCEKDLDSWPRKAGVAEPASAALQLSRVVSTTSDGPNSEECAG